MLERAQEYTGTRFDFSTVSFDGFKTLTLLDPSVSLTPADGIEIQMTAPSVSIKVDFLELLEGRIEIDTLRLNSALVDVTLHDGFSWQDLSNDSGSDAKAFDRYAFHVLGENCVLRINNLPQSQDLQFVDFGFDIKKSGDSTALEAQVTGKVNDKTEKFAFNLMHFTSKDDFELRAVIEALRAEDINEFLPEDWQFVQSGSGRLTARIGAMPGEHTQIWLDAELEELAVREQPAFVSPLTGKVRIAAGYDQESRRFNIGSAVLNTEELAGNVTGGIDLAGSQPVFDLELRATRLPVQAILDHALTGRFDEYGKVTYEVNDLDELALRLLGPSEDPHIVAQIKASGGTIALDAKRENFPSGALALGLIDVSWDSKTRKTTGSLNISSGHLVHTPTDIEAVNIAGVISVRDDVLDVAPLRGRIRGRPVLASLKYNLESKSGTATLAGSLAEIETTPLRSSIRNVELAGSGAMDATITLEPDRYTLDLSVDANQTAIAYRWWFNKAPGVGANGNVHIELTPKKECTVTADAHVAGSQLNFTGNFAFDSGRWRLQEAEALVPVLDVVTVGRCLNLPYTINGGTGSNGTYSWRRTGYSKETDKVEWNASFRCDIDHVSIAAHEAETPLRCSRVTLTGDMKRDDTPAGHLNVAVERAVTPALGQPWFVPMDVAPELREKYPPDDFAWTFDLAADDLTVPPWHGTQFAGRAYSNPATAGLAHYEAQVDDGLIEGSFSSRRAENAYTTTATWENVASTYFIEHLKWPEVLEGNTTGTVEYSLDRDDPRSLKGKGQFTVNNGQFSADYLLRQFGSQLEDMTSLPPSLSFSALHSEVEFEKDVVRTPVIDLSSPGMNVTASGQFIRDGDMDYEIHISIAPETAEDLPMLKEKLNVEGYRLSQQNIELVFNVTGPVLKPRGELTQAPNTGSVLVSGALQVTSEAISVLDTPRKILVDLLKIGGGIFGAGKSGSKE